MTGKIHIGTSGWSYKHWKTIFYPPRLPATKWLEFYTQNFDTTELNASFYRLPLHQTVINWKKRVPKDFLFCVKMSRYLTHMKKLNDPEETLEKFFDVFEPLKSMMGPVLIQLPPSLKFKYDTADEFYSLLKKKYRKFEFVMEVRHTSWLEEVSLTLMSKHNIGLVISQSGDQFPYSEMITAKTIYLRFHGPGELYASSYPDRMLFDFASKFKKWVSDGHEVWAFFNNDIHGHAIKDAKRLIAIIKKEQ